MRRRAIALAATLALSCMPPSSLASPSPTGSPVSSASPASPSVGVTPSAAASASQPQAGELRVQLDDSTYPAIADGEVLIVTRSLATGGTRIEAIELATQARTTVRELPSGGVQVTSVRDGVIAFSIIEDGPRTQTARVRVLAGRWRDPSTITELDDFVMDVFGGDSWKSWPLPETNGWEIVWLRTHSDPAFYELMRRDDGGRVTTVFTSNVPFTFSLSRTGEIAVASIAVATSPGSRPRLFAWSPSGGMRDVVDRPAGGDSGYVRWSGGKIAWSNGLGLVVPMRGVELIEPASGARETVTSPAGCFGYAGATDAQLSFHCGDHIELLRGTGPPRVGPPIPLVHARAIIRTEQGPPRVAFVTRVVTNDPRPGPGARF